MGETMAGTERRPEDVFTPRQPPSRDMFTARNEPDLVGNPGLQDRVREALREGGGQVILYGDTGVGKSTLLKYAAQDEGMDTLPIECLSGRSFDDHIDAAIRELVPKRAIELVQSASDESGVEAGISKIITIRGHVKNQKGQQVRVAIEDQLRLTLADWEAGWRRRLAERGPR